jgi:F420-non-reducing hydrogenase iron-sulfur subunit
MRMEYPANVKIIRVPCTGKVDALYLLKALESGVDGVYVAGCKEGDCHFLKGNIRARKRVEYVKQILKDIGIHPDRVAMYNLSAAEGPRFVEIAREFTEKVRALGPSPIKTGKGREIPLPGESEGSSGQSPKGGEHKAAA